MMQKNNDIHNFKILTIYSVIAYLIAYILVYLFYNLVTGLVANMYGIDSVLNYTKLVFKAKNGSSLWYYESAVAVFGAGSIFLIIGAFILIRIFKHYWDHEGLIKIFLFWIILHSFNRIIGLFITGAIFNLWYSNIILNWLFVSIALKIILIIIAFVVLIAIGSKSTKPLLESARSLKFVEYRKRLHFVWTQAFQVWFFSSIILFIIHLPSFSLAENLLSISMLLLIFPSYFNYKSPILLEYEYENEDEEPEYKIPWKLIIGTIAIILLFRIILWNGIPVHFN